MKVKAINLEKEMQEVSERYEIREVEDGLYNIYDFSLQENALEYLTFQELECYINGFIWGRTTQG